MSKTFIPPNWVKKYGEERGIRRLRYEMQKMAASYPHFEFELEGDVLYLEGFLITSQKNAYKVRIYFPEDYPVKPPIPVILDEDVLKKWRDKKLTHTRGEYKKNELHLCVLDPNDSIGQGWNPNLSSVTIAHFASKWLHALEIWEATGKWPLPEY
jgi:ubiquitin-protein ligase